jgi:hypothetical protein
MLTKSKFLAGAAVAVAIAAGSLSATGEASAKGSKGMGMMHAHHMHHMHHLHHHRHGRWYIGGDGGSCWVYTRYGLVNACDDDDD